MLLNNKSKLQNSMSVYTVGVGTRTNWIHWQGRSGQIREEPGMPAALGRDTVRLEQYWERYFLMYILLYLLSFGPITYF